MAYLAEVKAKGGIAYGNVRNAILCYSNAIPDVVDGT